MTKVMRKKKTRKMKRKKQRKRKSRRQQGMVYLAQNSQKENKTKS